MNIVILNFIKNLIKSKKGELHPILGISLGFFLLILSLYSVKFLNLASNDPDAAIDILIETINGISDIL